MIVTNTQNSFVVNSNNVEQNFSDPINAEIIQISRALSNCVINSNTKTIKAKMIGPSIPLYAVLDYCVRYLKNESLSDSGKKELEEIISLLIFKMPCDINLANQSHQVYSKFYQNPLHQPTESLPNFIDVIQQFKNWKRDDIALLVIRLYLCLLCKQVDAPEKIAKTLNITLDVLSGFEASPFHVVQDWYTSYLDRHLALLWHYLAIPPMQPALNRAQHINQIINLIDEKLTLVPNSYFLLMHKAFLLSRPEWFSQFFPFEAISCLNRIENKRHGVQLRILYFKYEQIVRSLAPYKELNKERLMPLVKELIRLKTEPSITLTDHILASCLIATIQIQYAKLDDNPNSLKNALNLMEEAWSRSEISQTPLSRFAESHALRCKIDWVLYCIFAGETKDYTKALAVVEGWLKLPSEHPLNRIGSEIKDCLRNATCPRLGLAFTAKTITFMERFKWLILGNTQAFYHSSWDYYDENTIIIKADDVEAVDQKILWALCKSKVIDLLQNQSIKEAENFLKQIAENYFKSSYDRFIELFPSSTIPFITPNPTQQALISYQDLGDIGYVDVHKIDEFMGQYLTYPGLPEFLFKQIFYILNNAELTINDILQGDTITVSKVKLSSIELMNNLVNIFILRSREFEGQPIYAVALEKLYKKLIVQTNVSELFQQILLVDERQMKRKHHWLAVEHSQHVNSLVAMANMFYGAYIHYCRFALSNDATFFTIFNNTKVAFAIARTAVADDENAICNLTKHLMVFYELHYKMVKNLEQPREEIEVIKLESILSKIMWIHSLVDEEEWHREATAFFNTIPTTIPDLSKHYHLKEPLSIIQKFNLHAIILFKPFFLVQEQRIEEALKLQSELHDYWPFIRSADFTNPRKVTYKLGPFNSKGKVVFANRSRLNKSSYIQTKNFTLLPTENEIEEAEVTPQPVPYIESHTPNFTKKEIREESLAKIKRETEKADKKRARVSNVETPQECTSSAVTTVTIATVAPQPTSKRDINKKAYLIFEKLFTQNNEDEKGPWENRSYRSDVKISRNEALRLIRALGGDYSESRGKGSHSLGHLSKLELDGVEIGVCDFETNEVLLCFTKAADLKFYQLSQLRDALIKLGYTPDTVISE